MMSENKLTILLIIGFIITTYYFGFTLGGTLSFLLAYLAIKKKDTWIDKVMKDEYKNKDNLK